jgi:AcrR family transcriptional regulator
VSEHSLTTIRPVTPTSTRRSVPARTRATALPPEERRAEIVSATLPLVLAHGASVTTRQIAEAAGIAEGTIFRVFADKEELFAAVVEHALDTSAVDAALDAIDRTLPLEARLAAAVDVLRRRLADVLQLRTAAAMLPGNPTIPERRPSTDVNKVASLFEPDAARLRCSPAEAAQVLRGLTIVATHPALLADAPMSTEQIVSFVLDGVRTREGDAC